MTLTWGTGARDTTLTTGASRASRPPRSRRGRDLDWLATADLVVCVGGPLDGQWFTATDWTARIQGARSMVERGQRHAPALFHLGTRSRRPHPQNADADGAVWGYRPVPTTAPTAPSDSGGVR